MRISASATNTWKSCKRKYYYSKTQPFKTNLAFRFGLAFEWGLEKYLEVKDIGKAIELAVTHFLDKDIKGVVVSERLEKLKSKGGDPKDRLSIKFANEEADTLIAEHIILLREMVERLITFVIDNDIVFEKMQLETVGYMNNKHTNLIRLDGVVTYKGLRWILELKSYKNFKSARELQVDNQLLNYMNVTSRQGDNFAGVLFIQAKKSLNVEPKVLKSGKLSTAKTQKCNADDYYLKATEIYGEDIPMEILECYNELLNNAPNIEMIEVVFTQNQLDNHYRELMQVADEMEIANKLRFSDMEEFKSHCYTNHGFSCSMCNYKDICYDEGGI